MSTIENKDRAEILADNLRQMRIKTKRETYQENLFAYLSSKLEAYNVPASVVMEIAQYTYTQTLIVADDEVYRAARHWRNATKRTPARRRNETE